MASHRRIPSPGARARCAGFSLVELMIAMVLGLALTAGTVSVYMMSKSSFKRQQQLAALQQDVRTAFEYLAADARMIGHLGCFAGRASGFVNELAANNVASNYAVGVEGYEYHNAAAGELTLASLNPANSTSAADWETNVAAGGINTVPIAAIAGGAAGDGLTPGSDALVIRTVTGRPVRLTAATTASKNLAIENIAGGVCSDGTTARMSGFCAGSHGLVASCSKARVFSVASIAGATLTVAGADFAAAEYPVGATEVFPMQTVAYYVKRSSSGTTTSLYRRTFDGNAAGGVEQELIEGVETIQLRYGRDTNTPADGLIDEYVTAQAVSDWSKVVAVRMSLVLRSAGTVDADTPVRTADSVNGVTVTYPTGARYDRRVFTTTVAIRNRIAYF